MPKLKIFVSYARVDEPLVRGLVEILRAGNFDPWFDHALLVGQNFGNQILEAIRDCDRFLYALTPESVASEWCRWEFAQAVRAGKPIVPVLMQAKTPIPEALKDVHYADLTQGTTVEDGARLTAGIHAAETIPPARVPLSPIPGDEPERPVESAAPTRLATEDRLIDEAYGLYREKRYVEARVLLLDCLLIDALNVEARKLLVLVEQYISTSFPEVAPPLPRVPAILPPPFEWSYIPTGQVTLEDAAARGGTRGGTYTVQAFTITKYPITNRQYRVFMDGKEGYRDPQWWDYSENAQQWRHKHVRPVQIKFFNYDYPCRYVSWYDATAFCRWLSNRSKLTIRLPSEQQWQRAAQGDDDRTFPWGNEPDATYCNILGSGVGGPTSVLRYPEGASPFGVVDLCGNVWEWCTNEWASGESRPFGDTMRALRGGSWDSPGYNARCGCRGRADPTTASEYYGFRIVCLNSDT
jgi:formylglycine-generating enzyme required for sulfatase activity